jgi:hypothetical protein
MNLAQVLNLDLKAVPVVILSVEKSSYVDSDGQPYYECKLRDLVLVGCSMDPALDRFQTDVIYVRERDLNSEGWQLVEEGKPESGFTREGWVVDFSQGQAIPIFQAESIREWSKGERKNRKNARRDSLNQKIRGSLNKA